MIFWSAGRFPDVLTVTESSSVAKKARSTLEDLYGKEEHESHLLGDDSIHWNKHVDV